MDNGRISKQHTPTSSVTGRKAESRKVGKPEGTNQGVLELPSFEVWPA